MPGALIQHTTPAPVLQQASTFDDRFEALMFNLVAMGRFTRQGTGTVWTRTAPLLEMLAELDLGLAEFEEDAQSKVDEGQQALWDMQQLPATVDTRLLLVESAGTVAKSEALYAIQQAVLNCECTEQEEPEPDPDPELEWFLSPNAPSVGGAVTSMSIAYQYDRLAVSVGSSVVLYSLPGLAAERTLSVPHEVTALHFAPSGNELFVGTQAGYLRVFDPATGQELQAPLSLPGPFLGQTINLAGTETIVMYGGDVPGAWICSLPDYTVLDTVADRLTDYNPTFSRGVAYSHNEAWVALAGFPGGQIRLVNTSDWSPVSANLPTFDGRIRAVTFTDSDDRLNVVQQLPAGYGGVQQSVVMIHTNDWSVQALTEQPHGSVTGHAMGSDYLSVTSVDPEHPVTIYRTSDWQTEVTPAIDAAWVSIWLKSDVLIVGHQSGLSVLYKDFPAPEVFAVDPWDTMEIKVFFHEYNTDEDALRFYVSSTPMDPDNLPTPVDITGGSDTLTYEPTLGAFAVSHVVTWDQTRPAYVRVGTVKGGAEQVSEEFFYPVLTAPTNLTGEYVTVFSPFNVQAVET